MKVTYKKSSEEKENYKQKIRSLINGIDQKVTALRVEGKHLKDEAKEEIEEQAESLLIHKFNLEGSLKQLKEHTSENWEDIKESIIKKVDHFEDEIQETLKDFKSSFKSLIQKFKS